MLGEGRRVQVWPPSALARISPPAPTVRQLLASAQATAFSVRPVPVGEATQLVPLLVRSSSPPTPTARQVVAEVHATRRRSSEPSAGVRQVAEPSAARGPVGASELAVSPAPGAAEGDRQGPKLSKTSQPNVPGPA